MSRTLKHQPAHIALTFKHMPGHADVHMSTVPEVLYLCGSEREKGAQDSTANGKQRKRQTGRTTCSVALCVMFEVQSCGSSAAFSNRNETLHSEAYL